MSIILLYQDTFVFKLFLKDILFGSGCTFKSIGRAKCLFIAFISTILHNKLQIYGFNFEYICNLNNRENFDSVYKVGMPAILRLGILWH